MGSIFHRVTIIENTVGLPKNFLYLKKSLNKYTLKQWFSKWAKSPPWGRLWRARLGTKQQGLLWGKTTQGGENAQPPPLIDNWVNFS